MNNTIKANPVEGGKQAVAEAYRNLTAVGATPLATTDNMNFGNPEKPEIMGQFVGAIQGIGEAVKTLDMPIVSGNVSLYNETDGTAILPTPTIGAVGIIQHPDHMISGVLRDGHVLLLLGETVGHLEQSALLAEVYGRIEGDAPHVDLVFGEDQGRYLIACNFDQAEALMIAAGQAGVPLTTVGKASGQDVTFGSQTASLDELSAIFRASFAQAVA